MFKYITTAMLSMVLGVAAFAAPTAEPVVKVPANNAPVAAKAVKKESKKVRPEAARNCSACPKSAYCKGCPKACKSVKACPKAAKKCAKAAKKPNYHRSAVKKVYLVGISYAYKALIKT